MLSKNRAIAPSPTPLSLSLHPPPPCATTSSALAANPLPWVGLWHLVSGDQAASMGNNLDVAAMKVLIDGLVTDLNKQFEAMKD
jgi:hypothetical protein